MRRRSEKIITMIISIILACHQVDARKRALTVFVGDYPENSGWSIIHSSNDKAIILKALETVGFQANDIICLENSGATRKAIDASFERLILSCRPGDQVYVHFSCHGQLITDVDGDECLRDARDRHDESLVPFDAAVEYGKNGYDGMKHLVDDAVNEYLCRLEDKVGKKGSVLVVFDACHSGDARREYSEDAVGEYVRGADKPFELPSTGELVEWLPREAKCVTISACRDFESNYECKIGGVMYGRLSYAVSKALRPGMTAVQLKNTIEGIYEELSHSSPLRKGRTQKPVFHASPEYSNRKLF